MSQVVVPPIVFGALRHLRMDLAGKDVAADDRDPKFHALGNVGLHNHRTEAEQAAHPTSCTVTGCVCIPQKSLVVSGDA